MHQAEQAFHPGHPMTYTSMGVTEQLVASIIRDNSASRPRNLQRAVGPSGIGTPCPRKLGYGILETERVNDPDPLAAWIGTASHASMEAALFGNEEWVTEIVTTLDGYNITGTADAYHRPTRTVVDWKFVGQSSLTKYKANGPGSQYRVQAHLYGCGLAHDGYDVDNVAVAFIPRNGMLSGIHVWSEPYDDAVVDAALRRYEAVTLLAEEFGPAELDTAEAMCRWCPWFDPSSTNPATSCAGHQPPPVAGFATESTQRERERVRA